MNVLTQEQNSMPVIRARMLTAMGLLNTKQPDIGSVLNARSGRSILKFEELEKSNAMRQKLAIARILGENLIEVTEQFMEMEKIRICTGTEPPDYRRTKEYRLDAARRLTTHKDLEK